MNELERQFWIDQRAHYLGLTDNIERQLGLWLRTTEARRLAEMVLRKAKNNPYLRRELGLPDDLSRLTGTQ